MAWDNIAGTVGHIFSSVRDRTLKYFAPEPQSRLGNTFTAVINGVGDVLGGVAGGMSGIDPTFLGLMQKQIEVQQQLELVSLHSNIERSSHETKMSAIRNIRVA